MGSKALATLILNYSTKLNVTVVYKEATFMLPMHNPFMK